MSTGYRYWSRQIRRADQRSAKEGALKRLDWLRGGALKDLDPVVADRAWRDIRTALQRVADRYAR